MDTKKILRCQGIELLTSDKVTRNVEYILNRKEAIWFDEKNKDILLMFNNGFIEINGIKVSFDQLKSFVYIDQYDKLKKVSKSEKLK